LTLTARHPALQYGFACVSVFLLIGARLLLDPVLGDQYPFATIFLAVIATAWYGGLRPALVSVVVGALALSFFLLPPREDFHLGSAAEQTGMFLYVITGLGISWLAGLMHRARQRAELSAQLAKTAETELRELNRELEARVVERTAALHEQSLILDLAHDTVCIRDGKDRITYWNEGAQRLYGWSKEEAVGRTTHSLLCTQFPQPIDDIMALLFANGSWSGELVHTRRDGSLLTVVSRWTLRRDALNLPASVIELNYDITAHRAAEREREKSESRLYAIFKGSPDGIVVFEAVRDEAGLVRDFRFVMVNPAVETLLHMNASDLIDQSWVEKFPSDASSGLLERFARTVAEDTHLEIEHVSLRGEKPQWYRIAAVKLEDGLVVNFTEITSRKLAEDKRSLLATRMGLAADVLHAGVWEWNVRSNVLEWDARMYEIYGLPQDLTVSYAVWANAVAPEDLPAAEAVLNGVVASKSEGSMEFRIVQPNGLLRHIQAAYGTILDDNGQVLRVVGVNIDVTEHRRTEERFQLVVEAAPNAMIMFGVDGAITLVNSQTEKLFGYNRSELLGRNIETLIPERFRSNAGGQVGAFFADPATRELYGLRRNGSEMPMEIALNPVNTADGNFVLASIVDITERRKAEERSLLLAAVIDGAKDYGIFMLNPDGEILTWNEGAARISGYSEGEIVGRHFSRFYPPEAVDSGVPENELRIARSTGKFEDEGWRVRSDGSRFWATILITAVHDKDGNLRGFSKLTRDTTERRRTEERFQRVVEASPSAMIIIGADGLITLVNTQTEKLFGYDRRELLGQKIEMLVPARYRAHHPGHRTTFFAAPAARAMGAGRDLFGVRKDGSEVPIEIGLSPISTNDGQFVLASIIDITQRKLFEAELQEKSAEMERFTYTVSHDLKSPLITIKSYISMIDQDLAAGNFERTRPDLQRVAKAAERMQILLGELLVLSQVGRVENTRETVVFASLVEEALDQVAGSIQQKNIHVEVAGGLPSVTVDRPRMVEVLQNLIENAAKFMGSQAKPEIQIGSSNDGTETRFFVQDNGIGLEAKHHKRIFGLFDKLNPKSEGSGAGLAIVKRIIELHGGRIWVESPENGLGSTFWFTLKGPHKRPDQEPVGKI
jgi:PAS domain S-box-containing protein